MGRLIRQALYSRSVGDLPQELAGPCDITDYDGIWERAARRVAVSDSDGRESYGVLRELQLQAEARGISSQSCSLAQMIAVGI